MRENSPVDAAGEGIFTAFDAVVRTHMRCVYYFCFRMTGKHDEADDAAQQTFVNVSRNMEKFRPGTNMKAWILAIAANVCRDMFRRKSSRRETDGGIDSRAALPDSADPADRASMRETASMVRGALEMIPEEQRSVLIMHAVDDLPLADIARSLEVPEGTIRWRFFKARKRLRELIGGVGPEMETCGIDGVQRGDG